MKSLPILLIASVILFTSNYEGSTTSAVTLVGGIIKSTHVDAPAQKYKRKNCPVCKGTGKYLSGDGIKMVDCGYCEPDKKEIGSSPTLELTHPPIILKQHPQCNGPNCKVRK